MKLIKKILLSIALFILGISLAYYSESFFRGIIQGLYRWTTSDGISFSGKNFYLFGSPLFFFGLASTFVVFYLINNKKSQIFKNLALGSLLFILTLIVFSAIDANMKIIECTACDNGIRTLHWNDINYGRILGLSSILSLAPSLINRFLKNKLNSGKLHPESN